jgi:uncharacterized delta-60 repeat protein
MKKLLPLIITVLTFIFQFSTLNCNAQAGTLDLSFGNSGIAVYDINGYNDGGRSLAVLPDGKFVMGGWAMSTTDWDWGLAYYNSDGSLYNNFSIDGKYTIDFGNGNDFCQAVNVLADGSILAAGTIDAGTYQDFALVKVLPTGILDATFATGGIFTSSFGPGNSLCYGSQVQSDGKVLIVGTTFISGSYDFAIMRVNVDGSIDTTFGLMGKVVTDIFFADDWSFSVHVLPDGSILVGGYAFNGTNFDFAVVKYQSNGSLDPTFGNNGIKFIDYNNSFDIGLALAVMTNGKFMIGGYSGPANDKDFLIGRFNPDASLDLTFDNDGWAVTAVSSYDDNLYSMKLQTDGKFIAVGSTSNGFNLDMAVVRYNADGSLDNTFGIGGIFRLDIDGGDDIAWSVQLTGKNQILVGGETWGGRADYNFAVIQLNNDPVSIDEQAAASAIHVYPNPFSAAITVRSTSADGTLITLFDYTGKGILHQKTLSGETILNTETLAAGLYFLKVDDGRGERNYKVVKQ